MAAKKRKPASVSSGPLSIRYELAELPSSQHRAGLAGLVLATRYLARGDFNGTCRVEDVGPSGATFVVDATGMLELFDLVYAATTEETSAASVRKDRNKQPVAPLRQEERSETDPKTGKTKQKTVYVYPVVVPKLAVALDVDPTRDSTQAGQRGRVPLPMPSGVEHQNWLEQLKQCEQNGFRSRCLRALSTWSTTEVRRRSGSTGSAPDAFGR